MATQRTYYESVPMHWSALLFLGVFDLAVTATGIWILAAGRWSGLIALLTGAFLATLFLIFARLQIRVYAAGLAARFGTFGPRITHADIVTATPLRYPFGVYLGWGIRYGTRRRRAYSVPFLWGGVELELRDGRWIYLSSRRPAELAEAVGAWQLTGSGAPPPGPPPSLRPSHGLDHLTSCR